MYSWRVPDELRGKKVNLHLEFDLAPLPTTSKSIEVQL
jgi:hypothetical protein